MRASLVNENGFEKLAKHINLGKYMFMSTAEENNNGRGKASLLSSSFEALIGAIYLEAGLDTANKIVVGILSKVYPKIDMKTLVKDYKTALQEITQAAFGCVPEYKLIASYGPDHNKEFKISVVVNDKELSIARGASKKKAEQEAAKIALSVLDN
jgi:ribonuclease-3